MTTYVALLRAVNVGKTHVAMADLRDLVTGIGHRNVRTYVQSGNVVFESALTNTQTVRDGLETAIQRTLGLDVVTIVRRASDLRKTLASNPLLGAASDPKQLHVTFLAEKPTTLVSTTDAPSGIPDEFAVAATEIYVHCPGGYGRTKLTNAWFEKKTGVAATTRNWNTVTKLVELTQAS